MSSDLHWTETNEADKIDYYNDRKHGIVELFVRVRLPYKFYEVASAISIIYNLKSFDDYVSELVYEDIERQVRHGTDIVADCIINKITGQKTEWHSSEEEDSDSKKDYVNVKIDADLVERLEKLEERKNKQKQLQQQQQKKEEGEEIPG